MDIWSLFHSFACSSTHDPSKKEPLDSGMCNIACLHQLGEGRMKQKSGMCTSRCLEIFYLVDILDEKIQSKSMHMHLLHRHHDSTRNVFSTNPKLQASSRNLSQTGIQTLRQKTSHPLHRGDVIQTRKTAVLVSRKLRLRLHGCTLSAVKLGTCRLIHPYSHF